MRSGRLLCMFGIAAVALGVVIPDAAASVGGAQRLWGVTYDGIDHLDDRGVATAVSPDGSMVFVTGTSDGDSVTLAYDAATGKPRWASRFAASAPIALSVAPAGTLLYLLVSAGDRMAVVAYHTDTGSTAWAAAYRGTGELGTYPRGIEASPDGSRVFAVGDGSDDSHTWFFDTVAFAASTGKHLWARQYHDRGGVEPYQAAAVEVSPDGSRVFVTGSVPDAAGGSISDIATLAYTADTGDGLWTIIEDRPGTNEKGVDLAVGPAGDRVYVAGCGVEAAGMITEAYDADSGTRVWQRLFHLHNGTSCTRGMAVSPDGSRLFVGGFHGVSETRTDTVIVAYDAATGTGLWSTMYNHDQQIADPTAPVVSPDGSRVYLAMTVGDTKIHDVVVTAAFDGATGADIWSGHHVSAGLDLAAAVAVSLDGARVFVVGSHQGYSHHYDYLTIAYAG